MLHFLFYRATTVDETWVEERTQDLRSKSYDLAHIDSIRDRSESSAGHADNSTPKAANPASTPPPGREPPGPA